MPRNWLLLVYRIPRQPSAARVFVWRKLKQLGAIALQDAIWVLPRTSKTQEQMQWLAAEILELDGDAQVWEADQLFGTSHDALRQRFLESVEAEYRAILAELQKRHADLAALSRRFQTALATDYFASRLGERVRERLLKLGEN